MEDTTNAAKAANGDVSLTEELPTVDAFASIPVSFNGCRYPVAYGDKGEDVDRPFWDMRDDAEPIFGDEVVGKFRDVAVDGYIRPDDGNPYRIPYDADDVPAVMLWSAEADEYMVVCDRDTVVVEASDMFGGTNRHEVDIVGMSKQKRGNRVTVEVETEDGSKKKIRPTSIRSIVDRGPEWVVDTGSKNRDLRRADT